MISIIYVMHPNFVYTVSCPSFRQPVSITFSATSIYWSRLLDVHCTYISTSHSYTNQPVSASNTNGIRTIEIALRTSQPMIHDGTNRLLPTHAASKEGGTLWCCYTWISLSTSTRFLMLGSRLSSTSVCHAANPCSVFCRSTNTESAQVRPHSQSKAPPKMNGMGKH